MTTAENIGDLRSAIDELKAEQLETFKQFFAFHETYNKEMKELAETKREVDEEKKSLEKSKNEFKTEWIHKNVSNLVYISFKLILVYINLFWFTLTLLCFGILYLIVN